MSSNATAASRPLDTATPKQETELLLAIPSKGRMQLYALKIDSIQTGATIMQLIKKEYDGSNPIRRWYQTNLVLEDAVISPVRKLLPPSSSHVLMGDVVVHRRHRGSRLPARSDSQQQRASLGPHRIVPKSFRPPRTELRQDERVVHFHEQSDGR